MGSSSNNGESNEKEDGKQHEKYYLGRRLWGRWVRA